MKNKTLDEWAHDYNEYRKAYNLSDCNKTNIGVVINWCHRTYPDELYPAQELFDEWGAKRETESNTSHKARIRPLNRLIDYMNDRGCSFKTLEHEPIEPTPEPRLITEEEFINTLKAADEMKTLNKTNAHNKPNKLYLTYLVPALEMPIMLRLLYSSGLRPPEIRLLDCKDVDLENGIIYIRKGKGYRERLIALHPEMNELLKKYDAKMKELMPNRIPFFPNENGKYISRGALAHTWRKLCDKYNADTAPKDGAVGLDIYTLRHLQITKNIENLPQDGYNKDIKLRAISQYAGHANMDITLKNYYHLTPRSGDVLDEKMGDTFNSIIPDIDD